MNVSAPVDVTVTYWLLVYLDTVTGKTVPSSTLKGAPIRHASSESAQRTAALGKTRPYAVRAYRRYVPNSVVKVRERSRRFPGVYVD